MGKNLLKSNKKGNTSQSNAKPKFTVIKSRKEKRKQERILKKQNKLHFYEKKFHPKKLKEIGSREIEDNGNGNEEFKKSWSDDTLKIKNREKKESEQKLKDARRKKELQRANAEEEKNIKRLEKQLKLNKRKGKDKEIRLPSSFSAEGLDYILDVCDPSKIENLEMSESEDDNSSGEQDYDSDGLDEELQNDSSSTLQQIEAYDINPNTGEDEELNSEISDDIEMDTDISGDENINPNLNENETDNLQDKSDQGESEDKPTAVSNLNDKENDYWEDIYGRTRDAEGNIVNLQTDTKCDQNHASKTLSNKYIPPAMRAKMEAGNEKLIKLKKQIKGLLNRLAESNMHSICRQLEELYSCNSRNDMNECLSEIISASILASAGTSPTPERLVMEHAVMIAILHSNVGNEVGAAMIQTTVTQFHKKIESGVDLSDDKYLDNHTLFLCQLYAFRVTTNSLIFHILTKLADIFNIKAIELIIVILRSVGFLLRKDNPEELKTLILKIQSNSTNKQDKEQDSRLKFMLDILLAIKNNNVKKIPNYDSSYQLHWQKIIKEFLRPGMTQITPFEIGYEEILGAESRGRWWIVGSAWSGEEPSKKSNKVQQTVPGGPEFNSTLINLARKMRMNTDTRKNIFCTLMSAEDFLEATERLIKLSVTSQQKEREIVFVILTCCLKEKNKFNPYYAQLAGKLSNIDRKYRMACQFAIWDRIKEIGDLEKYEINNLALFTSKLITDKVLSLASLKVIEFSDISKTLAKFLKLCILEIFKSNEVIQKEVFLAIAGYPKLANLRDGLKLFMRHFILKENSKKENINVAEDLKASVSQAEQNLFAGDKKFML